MKNDDLKPLEMADADLDESDIQAVMKVLRSGRLALGPEAKGFEEAMARYVGVRHAVAVSSGTAALHLIIRGLGLGPEDEVLVPSFTFAASVTTLLFEGIKPVFVDVEEDTGNLDPRDLASKLTSRSRAVMVVDAFGHPAPWNELNRLAGEFDLRLIDDCCEALGAEYDGRRIGSFGDAGAFAFYPNKQITTGEGGMVVTDDDELAATARSLCNQGRASMGGWLQHERLGYNYRMDEMSAALGRSQLSRLEDFLERRERVAELYFQRLSDLPWVRAPRPRQGVRMSWFVYVVQLADELDRDAIMRVMEADGVPTRAYFSPIHRQPFVLRRGIEAGPLPVTDRLVKRTLALPFHNHLTEAEVDRVVESLSRAAARSDCRREIPSSEASSRSLVS